VAGPLETRDSARLPPLESKTGPAVRDTLDPTIGVGRQICTFVAAW